MPILLLILLLPLIEIWGFIVIGGEVGAGITLLLVLLTGFVGVACFQYQGIQTWRDMRSEVEHTSTDPALDVIERLGIFVAGVFLLVPGFFTDLLGLLLLLPPVRSILAQYLIGKAALHIIRGTGGFGRPPERGDGPDVIEADYVVEDEDDKK